MTELTELTVTTETTELTVLTKLTELRLPVAPLLAHIEAHGGLRSFFPHYEVDANKHLAMSATSPGRTNYQSALHPEDRNAYRALRTSLDRYSKMGDLAVSSVDRICIALGVHPDEIYGDEWWVLTDTDAVTNDLVIR